ncbi:MAG TPA: alpha-ketoacid dehydrogenase subunit beta [Planctomycetota bacterium]|nr:alpha-ketoacid dehydrogenase subunit beta [Planctomycetota bacterium]
MPQMSYAEAIRRALAEEMERDERVVLLGEDIGLYGGAFRVTRGLIQRFGPERVLNTPISENGFVGVAVGAALVGLRPVVEIMFMDFIALAMDQIVNHAAKLHYIYGGQARVPLVIRTPAGAGRGYGASHSQSLEAWFVHVPGIKVVAPSTPRDAHGLLKAAIRDDNPVLFVESKLLYGAKGDVPDPDEVCPIGRAAVARQGEDVTLIAYSRMTVLALEAAARLEEHGIRCEVLDLRTLAPLDEEAILASVARTARAVIIEEDTRRGGVGAEVAAVIAERGFRGLDSPLRRVACADCPIPCSPTLEEAILPSVDKIVVAVESLI